MKMNDCANKTRRSTGVKQVVAATALVCFGTANNIAGRIKAKSLGPWNVYSSVGTALVCISLYSLYLLSTLPREAWRAQKRFFLGDFSRSAFSRSAFAGHDRISEKRTDPSDASQLPLLNEYPHLHPHHPNHPGPHPRHPSDHTGLHQLPASPASPSSPCSPNSPNFSTTAFLTKRSLERRGNAGFVRADSGVFESGVQLTPGHRRKASLEAQYPIWKWEQSGVPIGQKEGAGEGNDGGREGWGEGGERRSEIETCLVCDAAPLDAGDTPSLSILRHDRVRDVAKGELVLMQLPEALQFPRLRLLLLIGALDALGGVLGLMGQGAISGPSFSMSLQMIIIMSMIANHFLMRERYTQQQIFGVLIVLLGGAVAVLDESGIFSSSRIPISEVVVPLSVPTSGPIAMPGFRQSTAALALEHGNRFRKKFRLRDSKAVWMAVSALSTFPTAVSFVIREFLMKSYKQTNGPGTTGLSMVSLGTYTSAGALCFLPFVLAADNFFHKLDNIALTTSSASTSQLAHPNSPGVSVFDALKCLSGSKPESLDNNVCQHWGCCKSAPHFYLLYVTINMAFNLSLLNVTKIAGSLTTFLLVKLILPITLIVYDYAKLPLLEPADTHVGSYSWLALFLILGGIVTHHKGRDRCR